MLDATRRMLARVLRSDALAAEIRAYGKALNGNITMRFSKTTDTRPATSATWTKSVDIDFVDDEGNIHTWLNGTYSTRYTIADTSVAGAATIASTSMVIVNGRAKVIITGSAAAWLVNETATLTVATVALAAPLDSKTVAGGTFVITITA